MAAAFLSAMFLGGLCVCMPLGVKRSVPNHAVLSGHKPLQFFLLRSVIKSYKIMLSSNSATLKHVL